MSTPPMLVIRGDATAEEVAAVVAVLQATAVRPTEPPARRRSEWASPQRAVRTPIASGPAAWRSSALPR